jgi:hypothetical protein
VLLCRVLANKTYGVTFNAERAGGFANLGENPAHTATLTFKVDAKDPVTTVRRAMEAAKLQPTRCRCRTRRWRSPARGSSPAYPSLWRPRPG